MSRRHTFRLERVRALRERAEDQAKEELAGAMAEQARWAERATDAARRVGAARASQLGTAQGGASVDQLLAHQAFIERSEREHHSAELDLSRGEAEVDARRVALQQAAQQRQVLERLKEQQAAAHRLELERREGAELDELALSRHRRGAAR